MPEKPTDPYRPAFTGTLPVGVYRELTKFVKACGGVERAYEIAKLLNTMTIPISEILEGLETIRKQ
jgi:hypothetical protein